VGNSLSIARRSSGAAPSLIEPFTTVYHPFFIFLSLSDMSQPSSLSSASSFQGLFNAALTDYENQTGTKLLEHPLAKRLEACDSVDSIIAIFQEEAQVFRKFNDDGKIMKSIKSSVGVLYTLSNSTLLGEAAGLVHPKSFIGVRCS
jgi:hypothetical protein